MPTTGIYTGYYVWNAITEGATVWWADEPLIVAAYNSANDGTVPSWDDGPFVPNGWAHSNIWQYSSRCQDVYGWTGDGLDGDIVGPYPTTVKPPTPPPPTGQMVDILPYFQPSGQFGYKLVMKTGASTQPMQLEKRANDIILRKGDGTWIDNVRYQDSEQWRVKDGQVQKGIDTSDAGNGGRDGYDLGWAQWIPQVVQVGQTYHSTPTVKRFNRTMNCQVFSEVKANDYLYIKEIIPTWVSPANPSIVLDDVLVIEWRSGTPDLSQPPNETYYFAKGMGYCGWGSHFIQEITQGQQPLTGKLDCGM